MYDDEVLRAALTAIDMEESMLDRIEDAAARVDNELVTAQKRAGDCAHLRDARAWSLRVRRRAARSACARAPGGCICGCA